MLAGLTAVGLGAAPAAAAPFAYVTNQFDNDLSQFDAPLASFEALNPLTPATAATGTLPQGVAVSPDGKSAYVSNARDDTVSQYTINPSTGKLSVKSPATVAAGTTPDGVAVSPDSRSAYVANQGNDRVSQYTINPSTGKLSKKSPATVATGTQPVAVAVTPNGKSAYVANLLDSTVSQYNIDRSTGVLGAKSPATVPTGSGPQAVTVTPDGKSAYVANETDNTVSQYTIDPNTGVLGAKSPATVATGGGPFALAASPDADVSVKVSAPPSVKSGSQLTYAIKIANAGPSSAWQVTLKNVLPFGTAFQIASATSGHCTTPKTGTKGGTVACQLGTIKRNKSSQVHIVVRVTASANQGAIIDGATVSDVTPDPLLSNNKDHSPTKVTK
jgi:uncharacterized repeat protein (TIGR01451 family)